MKPILSVLCAGLLLANGAAAAFLTYDPDPPVANLPFTVTYHSALPTPCYAHGEMQYHVQGDSLFFRVDHFVWTTEKCIQVSVPYTVDVPIDGLLAGDYVLVWQNLSVFDEELQAWSEQTTPLTVTATVAAEGRRWSTLKALYR